MNDMPWMPLDAVECLKNIVTKDFEIFEWGSGGSTIFFANRCKNIVSIEYDKEWFDELTKEIQNRNLNNINLIYQPHNNEKCDDILNPDKFVSYSKFYNQCVFETYVKTIDNYIEFDLIIVDGRARISCVKRAVSKVKNNGFILIDDMDRQHYQKINTLIPKTWKLYFNNNRVKIFQKVI